MQVFSAANRLTGKPVYAVEIATNADDLKVAGEGGLLSFLAQRRFAELKGSFDSLCWSAAWLRAMRVMPLCLPGSAKWLPRFGASAPSAWGRFSSRRPGCSTAGAPRHTRSSAQSSPSAIRESASNRIHSGSRTATYRLRREFRRASTWLSLGSKRTAAWSRRTR